MQKYVALGCSLTAQDGFVNYLNETYNLDIENLAVPAGSNLLQIHKLNNLLIKNQVGSETTLLWQITSPTRNFALVEKIDIKFKNGIPFQNIHDWYPEKIELFDLLQTALLTNNDYFARKMENPHYVMQTLACEIYKWSKITKKIIVYLGWTELLASCDIEKTFDFLSKIENVEILPKSHSIVDWCLEHQLDFFDDRHPTRESYIKWGQEILVPRLGLTNL